MAFATDNIGLQLLIKHNIFNLDNNIKIYKTKGKREFIMNFEIEMSGVIMKNGYEISSFMQSDNYYKKLKYGDIHHTNKYFGITVNPVEIMFIKNNRIKDLISKRYIHWNSF